MVLRETFRHSLDIAQAVIFVALALGGFIAARNPASKPMIDALDLGGWQIAAIVFGSILAIRLLLAPYWLWKAAVSHTASAPERSIDHKLRVQEISDRRDKKKNAIQVIFRLKNSSYFLSTRYEVEDIHVAISGITNDNPTFTNMGAIVSPNSATQHSTTHGYF
jgi:hypothetical protein